ncbi:YebC/PmpR family DNA-binding transcriptional regulator [Candidatus Peribacteria bacterium]|jgi:YebC/PmpR family DNA-binding regulatory protein|nr:YebC/PmpR family DNA-binding transcriptional regulator [Candidatus Peribacteria bacterium]MBT4021706.1 YebC/PmpR family DNA-binding transcriptional regulator [Candidatus Peribacteria bacterium]MBT4241169.1 YebC/PmpR family DNA-binding transcriptional regulator [Candidatus Peribacteria bacterium]MBT4473922.1 YebC/PmpR family DNA-binding transcriptional regulator [Candidatus Peribacteria bacterium]
MSGHSKWHSIKHKKGAADAKRGKIFTRHAKLIEIATREGGESNPDNNPSLRTAIDSAKADNVPNANIDRAIKKGSGELKGEAQTVEVSYEAFGPGGVAMIIECLTDNKNRTLPNIKNVISKIGGRFADTGSVSWMFEQKGVVVANISGKDSEEIELSVIDAGADDLEINDGIIEIKTSKESWAKVRDALKNLGCEIETAGLKFVPSQETNISDVSTAKKLMECVDALEEDDDVSEVHTNADISDEVVSQL